MTLTTDEKIEITKHLLQQTKDTLNQNHKLVQFENVLYTPTITINISFYIEKSEEESNIYNEINTIISNLGIKSDSNVIYKYYTHLIKSVCKGANRRIIINNDIDNFFRYDFNREFYSLKEYISKYIIFKDGKFDIIENYEDKVKEFYYNK